MHARAYIQVYPHVTLSWLYTRTRRSHDSCCEHVRRIPARRIPESWFCVGEFSKEMHVLRLEILSYVREHIYLNNISFIRRSPVCMHVCMRSHAQRHVWLCIRILLGTYACGAVNSCGAMKSRKSLCCQHIRWVLCSLFWHNCEQLCL
jgi:hypothetical protein